MSLADALQDWKQLATTASELNALKRRAAQTQSAHDNARMQFEEGLEELAEAERESILSIMAAYDQCAHEDASANGSAEGPGPKDTGLPWLINKIGNEGAEGIAWSRIVDAWRTQYSDAPISVVFGTLNRNNDLFVKKGLGKRATLKLTSEGQSMFLGGQ